MLCCLTVFSSVTFSFGANAFVGRDEGLDALRAQFSRGRGPKTDGYAIDYSFFSPVVSKNDGKKYPLVVIMAGAREGTYEGKELLANEFAYWSSRELQNRFVKSKGAFILIARAPEEKLLLWNSEKLISPLKAAIESFAKENKNVDLSRLYVIGWCLGAKGALNLALSNPNFVSALVLMVPPFAVSQSEARALSQTPVWLIGSKSDSYAVFNLYIEPSWKRLCEEAADKSAKIFTSYDTAPDTTFFMGHNVWLDASHDFESTNPSYSGRKTVDASGKKRSEKSFIDILSRFGVSTKFVTTTESESCDCPCHAKDAITRLVWRVQIIFKILLTGEKSRLCKCGAAHWVFVPID